MNKLQIFDLSFCDLETAQQTNVQGGEAASSFSASSAGDFGYFINPTNPAIGGAVGGGAAGAIAAAVANFGASASTATGATP